MKPEILDELIALSSSSKRSIDCIVAVRVPNPIDFTSLEKKIRKAQSTFPKTAQHEVKILMSPDFDFFLNGALASPFHLEVALLENDLVALKMSHLLGDAVSMLLWLNSLFEDYDEVVQLSLKSYPSKKDTPYRKLYTSDVWPRPVRHASSYRNVIKFHFSHQLNSEQFGLNDIFSLALLDSLELKHKSLWLPVNVRRNFLNGFGNGLSRMRLYPAQNGETKDRLNFIKTQKKDAKRNGEISLPPADLTLNTPLKRSLFKIWLNRPWADWSSISFSHLVDHENKFKNFSDIWGIPNIIPFHQAVLFAFSGTDKTDFTFAYDPAGVNDEEASTLIKNFVTKANEIFHELS